MPSVFRVAVGALAAMLALRGEARAAAPAAQDLYVLEIDSDDVDDQAEALTGALRSHARGAPGWNLQDATQSLRMLTAALRCPHVPDAACLQRIGDQIKADRFVWGFVSKAGGHRVTADMHLWSRGKRDVAIKETYSDNLKDQNDDTVRKIASRVFDRLTGSSTGVIVVHAGTAGGTVKIDGEPKGKLDHGVASVTVSGGSHAVEVSAPGFVVANQNAVVAAGSSADVTFELTPAVSTAASEVPVESATKPSSTRRALAWTGIIGGGVLVVAGGVLAVVFESNRSKLDSDRQNNYGSPTEGATITDPCLPPAGESNATTSSACSARKTAESVLVPEIVAFGAGGALAVAGIVLLATDHKRESADGATVLGFTHVKVAPGFGPGGASLQLSASF